MKARLLSSLVLGAIAAAIVVIYDDKANHVALAAAAARNHTTVMSSLASGWIGVTLFVALIVFVARTVLTGLSRGRRGDAGGRVPQPRRPRADVWR